MIAQILSKEQNHMITNAKFGVQSKCSALALICLVLSGACLLVECAVTSSKKERRRRKGEKGVG